MFVDGRWRMSRVLSRVLRRGYEVVGRTDSGFVRTLRSENLEQDVKGSSFVVVAKNDRWPGREGSVERCMNL